MDGKSITFVLFTCGVHPNLFCKDIHSSSDSVCVCVCVCVLLQRNIIGTSVVKNVSFRLSRRIKSKGWLTTAMCMQISLKDIVIKYSELQVQQSITLCVSSDMSISVLLLTAFDNNIRSKCNIIPCTNNSIINL